MGAKQGNLGQNPAENPTPPPVEIPDGMDRKEILKKHLKVKEERFDKSKREIDHAYDVATRKAQTSRQELAEASGTILFRQAYKSLDDKANEAMQTWYDGGASKDKIQEIQAEVDREIVELESIIKGYIGKLATMDAEHKLTPKTMAEMERSQAAVLELVKQTRHIPKLYRAVKGLLGVPEDNKVIDSDEYIQTFAEALRGTLEGRQLKQEMINYLWTALAVLLPQAEMELLALKYVQGKSVNEIKAFFDQGATFGALPMSAIEKTIEILVIRKELTADQVAEIMKGKDMYQMKYQIAQELVIKRVKAMNKESIGAGNAMLQDFTLGNILVLVGQASMVLSMIGNAMANVFNQGQFEPLQGLKRLANNEWFLGSIAGLTVVHQLKKPWPEKASGKPGAQMALLDLFNRNYDDQKYFEQNSGAIFYFGQFLQNHTDKDGNLASKLKVSDFIGYLQRTGNSGKEEDKRILSQDLAGKARQLFEGREDDFNALARAFFGSNIFGNEQQAKANYDQALIAARTKRQEGAETVAQAPATSPAAPATAPSPPQTPGPQTPAAPSAAPQTNV